MKSEIAVRHMLQIKKSLLENTEERFKQDLHNQIEVLNWVLEGDNTKAKLRKVD